MPHVMHQTFLARVVVVERHPREEARKEIRGKVVARSPTEAAAAAAAATVAAEGEQGRRQGGQRSEKEEEEWGTE